jgi:hypothetical protein
MWNFADRRLWLSLLLLVILSGCAGPQFRLSRLPGSAPLSPGGHDHEYREVKVGSEVQMTLVSGQEVRGIVNSLGSTSVTVLTSSAEFSRACLSIPLEDIVAVRELVYPRYAKLANTTSVAVLLGVGTLIVWSLRGLGGS